MRFLAWLALLILVSAGGLHAANPKVVASTVEDGQDDADPALTEIHVGFDQPMKSDGWSIVGGGPTFPEIAAKPRWEDDATIVIPVRLRPNRDYWISINSDSFQNFRNRAGEPAIPQPLAFRTRGVGSAAEAVAPLTPERNRTAIDALRMAIDDDYAYRDRLKLDWNELFAAHAPAMESATTPNQFARSAVRLLRETRDAHVYVRAGDRTIATHFNAKPPNFNIATLRAAIPQWQEHEGGVVSAMLNDGIGYLLISEWNQTAAAGLDDAFASAKESKALIVDVRMNGGGDETLAQRFAGRFVEAPKAYSKNRIRRDGQWHGPFERVVEPCPDEADRYRGRVAVLVGPKTASSCESFALMMKQSPRCTLVGDVTKGSSGNPRPYELGNGVTVFLSSWEDQLLDGTLLEGAGVMPDVQVKTTPAGLTERDAVLNAALEILRDR